MNDSQQPRPSSVPQQPQQPHHPSIRPIGAAAAHPPRPAGAGGASQGMGAAPVRRIEPPPQHVVPPVPPSVRNATVPPPPPQTAGGDAELINLEDEEPIALEDGPATPVAPAPARIPAAGASGGAGAGAAGQAQGGLTLPSKIKFASGGDKHTYTKFKRAPHVSGSGACHVRSFHGRLSDDGLAFIDDKINEWLDNHPDVEVKFANCFVGPLEGKVTGEQGLIVVLWY